jgi:hypothetical protein
MKQTTFAVLDRRMGLMWGYSRAVTGGEAVRDVMARSLGRGYTCREEDFYAVAYVSGR